MKQIQKLLLSAIGVATIFACTSNETVNLIPKPKSVELSGGKCKIQNLETIYYSQVDNVRYADLLDNLLNKVAGVDLSVEQRSESVQNGIELIVDKQLDSLEYKIDVTKSKVVVAAGSGKTLAQSLSSLLQLTKKYGKESYFTQLSISDRPSFEWRSVMIDVARQWHPIESLYEVVELAHFYKLDKLHLHLSDYGSFTFGSELYPKLVSHNHYTKEQLKELVKFADDRGIMIIPEIDVPGHTSPLWVNCAESFGAVDKDGKTIDIGVVNMVNEKTYQSLERLLSEVVEVFYTSDYIHIGGDEVWIEGVKQLSYYKQFCKDNNLDKAYQGDANEVFAYFIARMNTIIKKLGKQSIAWEGFPDNGAGRIVVPNDVIIMAWNGDYNKPANLVKYGYKIINTFWEPCYMVGGMNYAPEAWEGYNWSHWKYGLWDHRKGDPVIPKDSDAVLGGQVTFWEQPYHYVYKVLEDRLPALAQRWWDYEDTRTFEEYNKDFKEVNKLARRVMRPTEMTYKGNINKDITTFTDSIQINLTNSIDGEIRYALLSNWELPSDHKLKYDGKSITLKSTTILSVQLYDKSGKKLGYPQQTYFKKLENPIFKYTAYKEPPQKGWDEMPNFDTLKAVQNGYFSKGYHKGLLETRPEELFNPYALKMEGTMTVKNPGLYKFTILFDDGSAEVHFGDKELDFDKKSVFKETGAEIYLEKGDYPVLIKYYYRHISNQLHIKYTDPVTGEICGLETLMNVMPIENNQ